MLLKIPSIPTMPADGEAEEEKKALSLSLSLSLARERLERQGSFGEEEVAGAEMSG
ncbi:hypothetical protein Mapa_017348 [Marchantia paleacea]|nr:hypothetical protein Mapa_017348 [Marchantia paleacea]